MSDSFTNKRRILGAMVTLMGDASLDALSVGDICRAAGLSRQTFYRTFNDKYAAVLWYVNTTLGRTCRRIGFDLGWREGYLPFLKFVERNADMMRWIEASRDYNSVHNTTKRQSYADYAAAYEKRNDFPMPARIEYQARMFGQLATIAIDEWIDEGCAPCADEFVDLLLSLVPKELYEALDMESDGKAEPAPLVIPLCD